MMQSVYKAFKVVCRFLERITTILIASINVTLNSLRILAWLFNFLLHACFGGAELSESSYKKRIRRTAITSTSRTKKLPN